MNYLKVYLTSNTKDRMALKIHLVAIIMELLRRQLDIKELTPQANRKKEKYIN